MGVGQSLEDSLQRWCGFNASVSARKERRWDKVLPKDEVEAANLSWLNGKEA
jgi:hypothetical protein